MIYALITDYSRNIDSVDLIGAFLCEKFKLIIFNVNLIALSKSLDSYTIIIIK